MIIDTVTSDMNTWYSRDSYDIVTNGRNHVEGTSVVSLFVSFDIIDQREWEEFFEDLLDARDAMEDYRQRGLTGTISYYEYRDERRANSR